MTREFSGIVGDSYTSGIGGNRFGKAAERKQWMHWNGSAKVWREVLSGSQILEEEFRNIYGNLFFLAFSFCRANANANSNATAEANANANANAKTNAKPSRCLHATPPCIYTDSSGILKHKTSTYFTSVYTFCMIPNNLPWNEFGRLYFELVIPLQSFCVCRLSLPWWRHSSPWPLASGVQILHSIWPDQYSICHQSIFNIIPWYLL